MTEKQIGALKATVSYQFREASQIGGVAARTLTSLAEAGLVDRKWHNSSLRGGERWAYRISNKGALALRRAEKAARS